MSSLSDRQILEDVAFPTLDLPADRTQTVVTALVGFDIVFWVLVMDGHVPMPGMMWLMDQGILMSAPGAMELGVFHVGSVGAVLGYVLMWGVMMWAMMFPAMTRFTREYARALRGSNAAVAAAVAAFLGAYCLVWALSGVVPLLWHGLLEVAGFGGIYGFTKQFPHLAVGGVLLVAGFFQLTEFKQSLLRDCCAHVAPQDVDVPDAAREGLRHGVICCTVCFGYFFLVMPFVGEMNFFWMVVLAVPIIVERLPTWGEELATASGVVTFLAGLLVLVVQPDLGLAFTM
ncbi:DUF2182 domain-containing protein [Halarchaeum sp. P4]|uniref:DUF2182 domain-containing protein n=1 Tax=Halarchaeum sp. P4 TaxID=3421639 RepID=UPI003EBF0C6A